MHCVSTIAETEWQLKSSTSLIMEKNNKLHLSDIVEMVSARQNISKEEADVFVKTLFSVVQDTVSEDKPIKIKDFGTFKLTLIHARESVDVNTGEKIEIPAHYRFSFHPATALRELVNKPFANFETTLLHGDFQHDNIPLSNENDDDGDDHGVVFVVEETIVEVSENGELVVSETDIVVEENIAPETSVKERKLPKHAFAIVAGITVTSIALLTLGLMCCKGRKHKRKCSLWS